MLSGKVVLVTGGSRGIGKAVSLMCAENGAHVIINFVTHEKEANDLVGTIIQRGFKAVSIKGDVSNDDDMKNLALFIKTHFGHLDILVNNAGVMLNNPIILANNVDFDRTIGVNCKGVFLCTKYLAKMMMKQKYGRIINISSIVGIQGGAGQAIYSGSKAFVIGYTKSAAKELGRYGITVNAIAPGFIDTDLTKNFTKDIVEKNISNNPLGRLGSPTDVAKVVLFLSSDLGDYVNGQVIGVDGGQII
jgi:3-oxoacyl-[acyl-carrier protein] reductase